MSHVEFKKWLCRPVDFRGLGPLMCISGGTQIVYPDSPDYNLSNFLLNTVLLLNRTLATQYMVDDAGQESQLYTVHHSTAHFALYSVL